MGPTPNLNTNKSTGFRSSIKSSTRRFTNSISPVKQDEFYALAEKTLPAFSTDRSSTSSRSSRRTPYKRAASSSSASPAGGPDVNGHSPPTARHQASASNPLRFQTTPTFDTLPSLARPFTASGPFPYAELNQSSASTMTTASFTSESRPSTGKPGTSQSNVSFGQGGNSVPLPPPSLPPTLASGSIHNPHTVYHYIQDMSSKRISTLDYLRKAHEGRVYWFNTLLFAKGDLAKMPYFDARKLARRASNYLLLGMSLPSVLDLNASNPLEYLRALNALLVEFESYQQIHSPDGPSSSSLSRARIPQMFKRATHAAGAKGRRTSSATEIGLPMGSSDPADLKSMTNNVASAGSSASIFPVSEQELFPGEEYTHLLTPSLPFDPDFFETFATLCDVLIDCYTRIIGLLPSPAMCVPGVGEIFTKADSRLRKIIVQGIVKEFEDASRSGAKAEVAGVSKIVLGGLV
ncbi:MAG: hypothetical protein L6R42_000676 [Xanthoria sp. 1 TBL-2021]|nr:MAG: hypothetical protein L6R42_000676 [Xanthoria sp. 1 TBL-2021]